MQPALSIVVPLYNSASTLDRLVAELTALDVPGGHELVLVDDGVGVSLKLAARHRPKLPQRLAQILGQWPPFRFALKASMRVTELRLKISVKINT